MPLHNHFELPLSRERPWEGIHASWASWIANQLNTSGVLPRDYFAMPTIQVGRVEVDVASYRSPSAISAPSGQSEGAAQSASVWAPPEPSQTLTLEAADSEVYEVQVIRDFGGPQLRAAIELVSPGNKDRPEARRAFAVKCAALLRRPVSLVVVDVVTRPTAQLHGEILRTLDLPTETAWASPTGLSAVAYRVARARTIPASIHDTGRLELWPRELTLGQPLPELPLWLEPDLCVPLRLEESYQLTCGGLRMGG